VIISVNTYADNTTTMWTKAKKQILTTETICVHKPEKMLKIQPLLDHKHKNQKGHNEIISVNNIIDNIIPIW